VASVDLDNSVERFDALIAYQRRIVEDLENGGKDVTSEKIILDSFQVSLSLCIHNQHRIYNDGVERSATLFTASTSPSGSAALFKMNFFVRRMNVLNVSGDLISSWKSVILKQIRKKQNNASAVTEQTLHHCRFLNFRPLTDEEKNEFTHSMAAKHDKVVAQLVVKKWPKSLSAA